jgi:hypothetical protein
MFEFHMIALAANLLPSFRFQTFDYLLAVHGVNLHINTHKINGCFHQKQMRLAELNMMVP